MSRRFERRRDILKRILLIGIGCGLCGAGSAALSYCFNRFLVFRRVRYACGPRMLFGAAVRTSLRLLFCCILHPLGLPLFAAWLIGSVLTVPLEYAYVRLTGPWWSSYALRRS